MIKSIIVATRTVYTILFGTDREVTKVETRKADIFSEFTDRLWKSVGINILTNILTNMLKDFKNDEGITLANCSIWNDGVTLEKSGWFNSDKKSFNWSDIEIFSSNGNFYIQSSSDNKFSAEFPYLSTYNIHFIESMIRMLFKNDKAYKLGDLLGA